MVLICSFVLPALGPSIRKRDSSAVIEGRRMELKRSPVRPSC